MVSIVSAGFIGSKYTRLLKHGEAGHTVAIVEVSWIDRPCGSSSRCITFRTPPYFGVCAIAVAAEPITTATANDVIVDSHLFIEASPVPCDRRVSALGERRPSFIPGKRDVTEGALSDSGRPPPRARIHVPRRG